MTVDDCYQELGVRPDASDAEIKAAWRKLAARWHPDRNPSPQALRKTQRINQALEEIRRARRQQQDEDADATTSDPAQESQAQAAQAFVASVDLDVVLTLEEVAAGGTRTLEGTVTLDCQDCSGSGRQPQPSDCPVCSGTGRTAQPMWFAWMAAGATCPSCEGKGSVHADCPACEASGHVQRRWQARVTLPPGLRTGGTLDATAELADGHGQVQLHLRTSIAPHPVFTADADGTLHCSVPVDGFAWMGERWVEVPTAQGVQQMRLRRGSLKYRIKGAGLPWQADGSAADCLIGVTPLFPQELDAAQLAAIDALVAGNSGAAATEAGQRMRHWQAQVQAWQQGLRAGRR